MKLSHIISAIEAFAPPSLQEKWDNSGLQVGLPPESDGECTGVLLCVDVSIDVVDEAARRGCNLIVSHHPLIFKGLRTLTGTTEASAAAIAAVRRGIAVYSAHTSLDSTHSGVSYAMAARLGATVRGTLVPAAADTRVSVVCPRDMASDVELVILGDDAALSCTSSERQSVTMESDHSDIPAFTLAHTPLTMVEADVASWKLPALRAALASMPQSRLISIVDTRPAPADGSTGLGVTADLPGQGMSGSEFVALLKERFGCTTVKASQGYDPTMTIRRIALCGGSGGEFIGAAAARADAYVSADIRYHDFADIRQKRFALFDIGHFESENCAKDIFYHIITNKFPNFAVYYSDSDKNPIQYL